MYAVALWAVVVSSIGVDVGWQPTDDGGLEYIIQIEPQVAARLKAGDVIEVGVRPELRDVRRYRIIVGTRVLPRNDGTANAPIAQPAPPADRSNPSVPEMRPSLIPGETARPTLTAVAPDPADAWTAPETTPTEDPVDALHAVEAPASPHVPETLPGEETRAAPPLGMSAPQDSMPSLPLNAPPDVPVSTDPIFQESSENLNPAPAQPAHIDDPRVEFPPIPAVRPTNDEPPTAVESLGTHYAAPTLDETQGNLHTAERYTPPERATESENRMTKFTPDPNVKQVAAITESSHDRPAATQSENSVTPTSPPKEATAAGESKPWLPLTLALLFLFASIGGNVYLGWINWDMQRRFRGLLQS